MSADSEGVFACYRFDGLERWTSESVAAWHQDVDVVRGYARHTLATTPDDPELQECLGAYVDCLETEEFGQYIGALRRHLEALGRPGHVTTRRG
jgi:hypothetical protein